MGIGSILQRLIDLRKTNVNEVSIQTGVAASTIYSMIRRDSKKASIDDLYKIAAFLNVPLEYFYDPKKCTIGNIESAALPIINPPAEYSKLMPPYRKAADASIKAIYVAQQEEEMRIDREEADRLNVQQNVIPMRLSEQAASAGFGIDLGPDRFRIIQVEDFEEQLDSNTMFLVPVSGDSMEPMFHDGDILVIDQVAEVQRGQIGLFTAGSDYQGFVKKLGDGELISLNPQYAPIKLKLNDYFKPNGRVVGVLPTNRVVQW